MPLFNTRGSGFKPSRGVEESWDNFRAGLNTLLRDTEIAKNELAQADNLMLIGKGVPTKRWGFSRYFLSNSTGSVRGLGTLHTAGGTNELLAITDHGTLTIKANASYTIRTGVSWASGYDAQMVQLNDSVYIVNGQREMARYSTPTLVGFPTIAIPTNLFATQISGTSGTNTYSYRVSAVSNVGETLASTVYQLSNQPQDLTMGTVKAQWSPVSAATGILRQYNVYGRNAGDERFLGSVLPPSTTFLDDGTAIPQEFTFPPTADSTGGINAKYILRFQDRLIFAGIAGEPSKVVISGRVPNHEKYDLASGGNYIKIEPDSGDNITGLAIFRERIVVFKERSIWQITLGSIQVGNFFVTQPSAELITASHGCIAPRSIANVENDIFFLSRKGVYVLGYEPNIAVDTLRTNELSAKIRPFFEALTTDQKELAVGTYVGSKYLLSLPGRDKTVVYDRERTSWIGPWTFDTRVFAIHHDSSNDEKVLFGQEDGPNVYELSSAYGTDNGTSIATTLKTRSEDFGDWSIFKIIRDIYMNLRGVTGAIEVDIQLEDRDGNTLVARSLDIEVVEGIAGWGADMWGSALWGDSEQSGSAVGAEDIVRWIPFDKAARRIQITIRTSEITSNYELLGLRMLARPIPRGFRGDGWQI